MEGERERFGHPPLPGPCELCMLVCMAKATSTTDEKRVALSAFHPLVQRWFTAAFAAPTSAQQLSWPAIAAGHSTLLLAPTGSGKTLSAFLTAIDRIMFGPPLGGESVTVLYISPLKALASDIERNLRAPLAGIRAVAEKEGFDYRLPTVAIRTGDTTAQQRRAIQKTPPDILITTPESLYLMLTSRARGVIAGVETVIIDEIHALAPTKRGTHLFLSLERLERLRRWRSPEVDPVQRIGLSATQRPLAEMARLLGGCEISEGAEEYSRPRPVEIVEASRKKQLQLRIETPVDDMARLAQTTPQKVIQTGPASAGPAIPSIWQSIYPRLVELIREHRSTIIFVNSRRLAERLATAINELADSEVALAHHGSIAKDRRAVIEDRLKQGQLPAMVATSSMELGIDMGAVDLVIQIEAPPSIASGIQRVGRSGHRIDEPSTGVVFPKYRGDLLACAAAVSRMTVGEVEHTAYPRNPLDVLAQQIVAEVAMNSLTVDEAYTLARSAAPYAELPRNAFEGVLDLLSGRYPSSEFTELRPRLNWDRVRGVLEPRRGAQRTAVANAGTIPDRGLYGVFLSEDESGGGKRVGELDEEMVYETRPGEVFLLGASSWRVLDITNDRVLVAPAPGEPGRMPFWRGDAPGRPLEFGRAIGQLTRELLQQPRDVAESTLATSHCLEPRAARNLMDYLCEQREATGVPPSDRTIVVETFLDEIGDWRVVILTPFGARVHAPWAIAVGARLRNDLTGDLDMVWGDDGIVFRIPESDDTPDPQDLFPDPEEIEEMVVRELGGTAMFASHFRENAARALLLPRRQPGRRTPLWMQRRKSADLLKVAARYDQFPISLETLRECLRDVFDLPGLRGLLDEVQRREIRVHALQSETPSPFAASVMFSYAGNFLYEGDAPLAERRAQSLALDHAQLRELLGDSELRELLDADAIAEIGRELQRLDGARPLRDADDLHDLLRHLGDLSTTEIGQRSGCTDMPIDTWLTELERQRRALPIRFESGLRWIAAEDASVYRDALGFVPPQGLPHAFLEPVDAALEQLVARYARTHTPLYADQIATRLEVGISPVQHALGTLLQQQRVLEGEFLPGGRGLEWCDTGVMKRIKRRSLARLRKQVEPVEAEAFTRFLTHWQGLTRPRRGLDGLLDVVEQLQGCPLPASVLEADILPARLEAYRTSDLDELCSAGEVVWRGVESIGAHDGRIVVALAEHASLLPGAEQPLCEPLQQQIIDVLGERGALYFDEIVTQIGGFSQDLLQHLWELVWRGVVTNDTLAPLRSLWRAAGGESKRRRRGQRRYRSRRTQRRPGTEGRWSLFETRPAFTPTERQTALASQLVDRYGVVTRQLVTSERIAGGFSGLYPVFRAMEEMGRVRRGYFVAGQGAAQFAAQGADDQLRNKRPDATVSPEGPPLLILAACDPATPYGAALPWPEFAGDARPHRATGACVVLDEGVLLGHLNRSGNHLITFVEPGTGKWNRLMEALRLVARDRGAVLLTRLNGVEIATSPWAPALGECGFVSSTNGFQLRSDRHTDRHTRGTRRIEDSSSGV